jgi:hypothetical protein
MNYLVNHCVGILTECMFTTSEQPSFESLVSVMADAAFHCSGALEFKQKPSQQVSGVVFLFLLCARWPAYTG